jgi:hypothetical protein
LASGGGAGIAGAVGYLVYRLHRDAVAAVDQARKDWREMALAERARADLREQQLGIMLGQVSGRVSGRV